MDNSLWTEVGGNAENPHLLWFFTSFGNKNMLLAILDNKTDLKSIVVSVKQF
jgi:hypothetical protein